MANHGGARKGAGRKSRADELKVAEKFRNVLSDEDVITKLSEKVESGDMKAIELWLGYVIGKPQQFIDVTTDGEKINIPISEWVKTRK
jgi:hypothetical protein